MKLPTIFSHRRAAFTLTEMMVALAIFSIGVSIAYPFLVTQIGLYARNFSINKSNNSLRYSLQRLNRDLNMAVAPPTLATYTVSGSTATLTPMDDTKTAAEAMILYVNFGPAYNMPSLLQDNKSSITNPALGITLVGPYVPGSVTSQQMGMPSIGDRLLIMAPSPSSNAMLDQCTYTDPTTGNLVTYTKPGRKITGVTPISNSASTGCRFTVTIDPKGTVLPGNGTTSNPYPPGDQSVYLLHESAYMTYAVTDSANNVVEKQLRYVESTANLNNPLILIHDLDTDPKELVAGVAAKPFNYTGGRINSAALTLNLPIRAFDYAHAIAERGVAAGQVNVSSEFNVFIRSNPTMSVKCPLD